MKRISFVEEFVDDFLTKAEIAQIRSIKEQFSIDTMVEKESFKLIKIISYESTKKSG